MKNVKMIKKAKKETINQSPFIRASPQQQKNRKDSNPKKFNKVVPF